MAMSPEIYMGLAQLSNDYYNAKDEAVSNVLAQVNTDDEADMAELE